MAAPVVVTAHLRTAHIAPHPIHLDGILALAWVRRHRQHAPGAQRGMSASEIADAHLPLVRVEVNGSWCWAASAGVPSSADPAAVHQTRRRDPEDWDRLDGPVNVAAGPGKDVLMRRQAIAAPSITWHAYGSLREIRASLRLLWGPQDRPHGFLGSARRSGAGELASWSAVEGDHSLAACFVRDGRAVAHLPAAWVDDLPRGRIGAFRPPRWMPSLRELVAPVGAEVMLADSVLAEIARIDERESRAWRIGRGAR